MTVVTGVTVVKVVPVVPVVTVVTKLRAAKKNAVTKFNVNVLPETYIPSYVTVLTVVTEVTVVIVETVVTEVTVVTVVTVTVVTKKHLSLFFFIFLCLSKKIVIKSFVVLWLS